MRGDAPLTQKRYTNAADDAAPISSCAEIPNVYTEAVHGVGIRVVAYEGVLSSEITAITSSLTKSLTEITNGR